MKITPGCLNCSYCWHKLGLSVDVFNDAVSVSHIMQQSSEMEGLRMVSDKGFGRRVYSSWHFPGEN
jgi:murein endopeptidase